MVILIPIEIKFISRSFPLNSQTLHPLITPTNILNSLTGITHSPPPTIKKLN